MVEQEFVKDPMELDEGHFSKDEIAEEENFKNQFKEEENFVEDPGGMLDEGTEESAEEGTEKNAEEGEKFEFDQSLAAAEKAELEELNDKLGTNFEDLKSLKDALNRQDTKEAANTVNEDQQLVNYFESVLNYSNRDIVMEDKKMLVQQDPNQDIKNPETLERLEEEVSTLEENGTLEYAARSIKADIRNILDKKKASINAFNDSQKVTREKALGEKKDKIQASINEIFKSKTFLGIQPSREALLEAYTDVSKDKHIDHLRAHPEDAVEYVLFKKYKGEILKKLGKPDFKAGVKSTLDSLGMEGSQQTSKPGTKTDEGTQEELSYFQQFIK